MKKNHKKIIQGLVVSIALVVLGIVIGTQLGVKKMPSAKRHSDHQAEKRERVWTCSMHPQVRQPNPGKCPICGMDFIPAVSSSEQEVSQRSISMSEASKALARIETALVERRQPEAKINLYGKIAWDETRVKTLSANFSGRIDRLFLDYTGVKVRRGDHLAEMYSPDLLSAQAELISAKKYNHTDAQKAARDKLRLWGFGEEKIEAIEQTGKPSDRLEINSPLSGIVIEKNIHEGDYLQTGVSLFKIADASRVWVLLDAYENDLPWLRYGQDVTFSVEGIPGKDFKGRISFISPELDPKTRTVKIRVNAENSEGFLRPGMFARAVVKAKVVSAGKVIAPNLVEKWICPMHPEIVSDEAEDCSLCGMGLVQAKELGYVSEGNDPLASLVIPVTAPLITGKRAVVYVEAPQSENPTYEGRSVKLGARAGDYYLVEHGLREGERVVVEGAFMLDASLQISGKQSMMSEERRGKEAKFPAPTAFCDHLSDLIKKYYLLQKGLVADDLEEAHRGAKHVIKKLLDMRDFQGEGFDAWLSTKKKLATSAKAIRDAKDLKNTRTHFEFLSEHLIFTIRAYGTDGSLPINLTFCPMAFDGKGANWLQEDRRVSNPYFGKKMLKCGALKENLAEIQRYSEDR